MNYPMKEVRVDFGNSFPIYRKMTPQEYEKSLNFYRMRAEAYSLSSARIGVKLWRRLNLLSQCCARPRVEISTA